MLRLAEDKMDSQNGNWPAAVAAAGAAIGLLGLYLRAPATAEIGFAALAGAALSFVFNSRRGQSSATHHEPATRVSLACTTAVVILLAVCTVLGRSVEVPPQTYFILASITAALIALQIAIAPLPQHRVLILAEIVLLALVLRAVLLFAYPSLYGTDTWEHAGTTEDWYAAGRLLREGIHGSTTYYSYPVTYLQTIAVRLIGDVDVRPSMFFAISVPLAFVALTAYCIGRVLMNDKVGLLAALSTSFNQFLVVWGAFTIPTVVGVVLFGILLLQAAKPQQDSTRWPVFLLLAFTLICTHTISAFIAAIALVFFAAVRYIAAKTRQDTSGTGVSALVVGATLFVSVMLARWLYAYSPDQMFFERVLAPFWNALLVDAALTGSPFEPAPSIWNRVAFLMLIAMAVWGGTVWLRHPHRTSVRVAWILAASCVAATMFAFTFFGIKNLIPQRWLAFNFILATPAIGTALATLLDTTGRLAAKTLLMALLIFVWAWFSLNTNFINLDTPFYETNGRYPYTASEQAAVKHSLVVSNDILVLDRTLWGDYPHYIAPTRASAPIEPNGTFLQGAGIAVLREYAYDHPETTGGVPLIRLLGEEDQPLSTVYSNRQASVVLDVSRV